jgi:acetyl-CoA carboxylase carboxyltransferase component
MARKTAAELLAAKEAEVAELKAKLEAKTVEAKAKAADEIPKIDERLAKARETFDTRVADAQRAFDDTVDKLTQKRAELSLSLAGVDFEVVDVEDEGFTELTLEEV